ncbi:MAG: AEC family transporter, partial [Lachnospiraceae bacterium]|nr:AEC family transporter [Lachnospiraceae bacterium]
IIYTYGAASLKAVAKEQHPDENREDVFSAKDIINSGTVMAVITIVVYLLDIKMPDIIDSTLNYIADCTTFLSMIVLGVSVAQMVPKEVFTRWRLYVFLILRQILVPVLFIFVMKMFITNELILKTIAVMAAMPAANMPLMMAKQYGVKEDMISAGIILTTLTSIITIPAVMYFL